MRAHGIIGLAALLLVATPVSSQPTSDVPPTPAIPSNSHAVTADDFPAESIRNGEQGTVIVRYLISETGNVIECTVTKTSGFARLDAAACSLVRRWTYTPATEGGKATMQNTTANIVFQYADIAPPGAFSDLLKFQDAAKGTTAARGSSDPSQSDSGLDVPASFPRPDGNDPACPAEPCTIAIPITDHTVLPEDYPRDSVWLAEQGAVQVRYVIGETGDVTECSVTHSSGSPRLDAAACRLIRSRWKYRPATEGGKPVAQANEVNIVFQSPFFIGAE